MFEASLFEQIFDEPTLKKGWRLYGRGWPELTGKSGSGHHFLVETTELHLKKKAGIVLSWRCGCQKKPVCEHLATVMFWFNQDALGLHRQPGRPGVARRWRNEYPGQWPRDIKGPGVKTTRNRPSTPYDGYIKQMREIIRPFLKEGLLSAVELEVIFVNLSALAKATRGKQVYFFRLALVIVLSELIQQRTTGNPARLYTWFRETRLWFHGRLNLSAIQRQALHKAVLESLRSNQVLHSEAFFYLLPALLALRPIKAELDTIENLLDKRRYKMPFSKPIDLLLVARIQLALCRAGTFHGTYKREDGLEVAIAAAELALTGGHTTRGFRLLVTARRDLPAGTKYHLALADYIITRANDLGETETELRFLKEKFIHGVFIHNNDLERFIHLVPRDSLSEEIDQLIKKMKLTPGNAADKMAVLLLSDNRPDDLIRELGMKHEKFMLIHQAVLHKWPVNDKQSMAAYARHLALALSTRNPTHQKVLVQHAKTYLDKLPTKQRDTLVADVRDQLAGLGYTAPRLT